VQAPETESARRVGASRRSSEVSDSGSATTPQPTAKVDAVEQFARGSASDPAAASTAGPAAKAPHAPVWEPEPERDRPPPIPNWGRTSESMSWPDARWEHASETTLPRAPVHAAFRTRGRRRRRSRAFVTTVALVSLFVVFVAAAVIMSSLHRSTPSTAGPRVASTPAVSTPAVSTPAVSTPAVSRLQAATDAATSATTTARSRLDAISGIPTPAKVASVINPYFSALQNYETALVGTAVPTTAKGAASAALTQVSQDVQFLGTLNGLAPVLLGSYLGQFGKNATQLQADLSRLEAELRTATS